MSALPHTWSTFTLSQIGGVVGGKTPSKANSKFWNGGNIPWVSPKDMKKFRLTSSEDKISEAAITEAGMELLPENSILLVTRSGILAHTLPIALIQIPVTINQDIKAIRPSANINSQFIAYNLLSHGQKILNECSKSGTTVASVETKQLEAFSFPLAPLAEQKRIADKLDTVLARVDACRERLDRVPLLLKRFRQSVLAAAISGRLTEDFRKNVNESSEWGNVKAGELCEWITKGTTPPKSGMHEGSGDVPYVKVYNLCFDGRLDFTVNPTFVNQETHEVMLKRSKVFPGDVLMNIVGPPLGKVSIVPSAFPEWNINQAIAVFRAKERIYNRFLAYFLMCDVTIANLIQKSKATAGQFNLTLEVCRQIEIPLPSMAEQQEIVRRVETLFAFADRLEARLVTARTATDRLTPALLAKAFRGELVPQDPNDEPASELLKRLAAQREAAPKSARGRKAAAL